MTTQQTTDKQRLLDEARDLLAQGEEEDALARLEAALREASDEEARLAKAEMYVHAQRAPEFIGETALAYHERGASNAREQSVVDGALAWAENELVEGRLRLARDKEDGVRRLRRAQTIAPWAADLSLAAAFIIDDVLQGGETEPAEDDSGWPDGLRRRYREVVRPGRGSVDLQGELRSTLERAQARSGPGDGCWEEATSWLAELLAETDHVQASRVLAEASGAGLEGASGRLSRLRAREAERALERIAGRARLLLHLGEDDRAAELIEQALVVAPDSGDLWILAADWLQISGHAEHAIAVYKWLAWRREGVAPRVIDPSALQQLEEAAKQSPLACPRCRHPLSENGCRICGFRLPQRDVVSARLALFDLDSHVAGRLALALLLDEEACSVEVFRHAAAALRVLPKDHPARELVEARHERLHARVRSWRLERTLERLAGDVRAGRTTAGQRRLEVLMRCAPADERFIAWSAVLAAHGDAPDASAQAAVGRALALHTATWAQIPLTERRHLAETVGRAGWLAELRALLPALFSEGEREREAVSALVARQERVIRVRCAGLTTLARSRLVAGQVDEALRVVGEALAVDPDDLDARLLRGQAQLQSGAVFLAAEDFSALREGATGARRDEAIFGLAQVYEALGDITEAQRMLTEIDRTAAQPELAEEADRLDEQLARRRARRPAVLVRRASPRAEEDATGYQAVFAIEIAAAARWRGDDRLSLPRAEILRAGQDFVSTLAGLAQTLGRPSFSLRLVAEPEPDAPSHGRLRIAILCAVSHAIAEVAEHQALELWHVLRGQLPLAEAALYQYEPVFDEGALRGWLKPFPLRDVAEIVRPETLHDDGFVVYPFTSGGTPLVNLARVLLHQQAPALVDIHLEPTELLGPELIALVDNLARLQRIAPPSPGDNEDDAVDLEKSPGDHYLLDPERSLQLEVVTGMRRALERRPFALRICIASAVPNNHMLPHAVASELLGPGGRWEVVGQGRTMRSVLRRGLRDLEFEPWTPSAAPAPLTRLRFLVGEAEAGLIFRLPMPDVEGIPGLPAIDIKPVAPSVLPSEGVSLGETVAMGAGVPQVVRMRPSDRRRHAYVVGKTGVGKSTLMEGMALQDIAAERGVAVLDPHGDLIEAILRHIPAERADDVIVFDPSDEARPIGLNFLEAQTESQRHRIATEFIQLLMKMYDPRQMGIVGPRFQHNVRNAMLTVMEAQPGATLVELVRALTDSAYVKELLPRVRDPLVRNYWLNQIANTSDYHKSEILDYIVSKFNRFVGDRLVRNIVGQSRSTLDFRTVMDERKILLVNLSKGKIGPENAEFLGFLLLQSLLIAALSRADRTQHERRDFCLYVDEFQTFATESFSAMLSEGRKYGLCLVMANQYLSQLTPDLQQAVFGNVGTLIAFQVGVRDAPLLAEEFYPVFSANDLLNVPRYTAAVRLLVDGLTTRPFAMRTRLVRHLPDAAMVARIKQASRLRYGRDAEEVAREISMRFPGAG